MLLNAPPGQILDALIAYVILILLCFPIHEFGHAWVARRLGDTLALREGRVTLNPFAHIDPVGAIALAAVGFGWAKPVPFYPSNLRRAPNISVRLHAEALTSGWLRDQFTGRSGPLEFMVLMTITLHTQPLTGKILQQLDIGTTRSSEP